MRTARQAAAHIKAGFGSSSISLKADRSYLTPTDEEVNQIVVSAVKRHFPRDGIISEEGEPVNAEQSRQWICDPIDGTSSFSHQVPTFAFSLALAVDGVPIVAVAYDVMLDRMLVAEAGKGTECNGRAVTVSQASEPQGQIVGIDLRSTTRNKAMENLEAHEVHVAGTPSVVYRSIMVALGQYVGAYGSEKVNPHDCAAAYLIVTEAGGTVTDMLGNSQRYDRPLHGMIASNGKLHQYLVDAVT